MTGPHGHFARSAGESAYPHLWTALEGAWFPGWQAGPMDESTAAYETTDLIRDYSGNQRHGTMELPSATKANVMTRPMNSAAFTHDGRGNIVGSSMRFRGNATSTNRVNCGSWLLRYGPDHITIISRIFMIDNTTQSDGRIISRATDNGEQDHDWMMGLAGNSGGGQIRTRLRISDTTVTDIGTGNPISDNAWHDIAASYDGTTVTHYHQGKVQNTFAHSGTITDRTGVREAWIGSNPEPGGNGDAEIGAFISYVFVYSCYLNQRAIQQIHANPTAFLEPKFFSYGLTAAAPAGSEGPLIGGRMLRGGTLVKQGVLVR